MQKLCRAPQRVTLRICSSSSDRTHLACRTGQRLRRRPTRLCHSTPFRPLARELPPRHRPHPPMPPVRIQSVPADACGCAGATRWLVPRKTATCGGIPLQATWSRQTRASASQVPRRTPSGGREALPQAPLDSGGRKEPPPAPQILPRRATGPSYQSPTCPPCRISPAASRAPHPPPSDDDDAFPCRNGPLAHAPMTPPLENVDHNATLREPVPLTRTCQGNPPISTSRYTSHHLRTTPLLSQQHLQQRTAPSPRRCCCVRMGGSRVATQPMTRF